MLNFFVGTLLRKRFSGSTVKKTDDEITRYLKQSGMIKRRGNFEKQLSEDLAA